MSSRDSCKTYIHLRASHQVLYREEWTHETLPFDDIEITGHRPDEDDGSAPVSATGTFGAAKPYSLPPTPPWKDLSLEDFLTDRENAPQDRTILKHLTRSTTDMADLPMSRGLANRSSLGSSVLDSLMEEGPGGFAESPARLHGHGQGHGQVLGSVSQAGVMYTPEMNRVRPLYETPTARIIR